MSIRYIASERELLKLLLEPFAHIVVLRNGQMTLSTIDARIDILMVYDLVHKAHLRIATPVTIEITDAGRAWLRER